MIGGCALNHGLEKVRVCGKGPCTKVWDVRARWLCTVRDNYEDQGLCMRWCPAEVSQWLVELNAKKAQAQLMCWPTNYCCLVSHRVRLIHGEKWAEQREQR